MKKIRELSRGQVTVDDQPSIVHLKGLPANLDKAEALIQEVLGRASGEGGAAAEKPAQAEPPAPIGATPAPAKGDKGKGKGKAAPKTTKGFQGSKDDFPSLGGAPAGSKKSKRQPKGAWQKSAEEEEEPEGDSKAKEEVDEE